MKLGDAVSQVDTYSGRASESVRALAFAGLAFVWLVAKEDLAGVRGDLLLAAALLLLALFADFLHYIVGAVRWDLFVRKIESTAEDVSSDTPISPDAALVEPIYWAFYAKIGVVTAAYLALAYAVLSRVGK